MKVDGSLGSLAQGVSQQPPTERRLGQHGAQVNMIADPVRGLSRRHGTIWKTEQAVGGVAPDATERTACRADAYRFRAFDYTTGSRELTVLYRDTSKYAGSTLPVIAVYDKTANKFLNVVRNMTDPALDTFETYGASAITAVGKYALMAGNGIVPAATTVDNWTSTPNVTRAVLWVRGGAYGRTFSATVIKSDDTEVSFSYTTPPASYPGVLDTSGVSVWIPDASGATPGTAPTVVTANETPGLKASASTHTVAHSADNPKNYVLTTTVERIEEVYIGSDNPSYITVIDTYTLVKGADYSVSAGVITFLRDFLTAPVKLTYQYETGGSSATVGYVTEQTTEAAYVRLVNGVGVADLVYKDWDPTGMTARHGVEDMTNVYPAAPASPSEYSWGTGDKQAIFHASMVNNLKVTLEYTHTKVLSNPNYTKQVADITNAYNTAVTAWIGTASAAIQPDAIAKALRSAATVAGVGASRKGSTVYFSSVKAITVSDGGDGTLLKGVANKVKSVDDLSDLHYVGKVVQVNPTGGEVFYMKATAKDEVTTSGVTEVVWVEGARNTKTITQALIYGVADTDNFYIASTAALLNAIYPGDHPEFTPSAVGDDDSCPMPYFIGKKIKYLGVFQDRLLIGADAVLRCSKIGDYLNFFRASVLSVAADDSFELLSQGSEDDVIRFSVLYDRDLVLFGKRQYAISGRAALTPTSAHMPVISSHQGADDAPPVAAGSLIFYAKRGLRAASVHQIEAGRNPESPESYSVSTQLDDYLLGTPRELATVPKPNTLLLRTTGAFSSLFVYSYLDTGERRMQDCWCRWDYSTNLGRIMGVSVTDAGVLIFTLRQTIGQDAVYHQYIVADLQPLDTQLSDRPYLDSTRLYSYVQEHPGSLHDATTGFAAAYNNATNEFLHGVDSLYEVAGMVADFGHDTGITVGYPFDAYWTPTNPSQRDGDGKAIKAGRLVVTSTLLAFEDSSGFRSVVTAYGQDTEYTFNGRILGDNNNVVGKVPVTDGLKSVVVGRGSKEYTQTIHALTWLPLTLTSVDWTGQLFHRPQRVG